jgi:hypothetical protein
LVLEVEKSVADDAEKVDSPIQGVVSDGPDDADDSFAVGWLDDFVDLSPKRAQKKENTRAGEEYDEGEASESCERVSV